MLTTVDRDRRGPVDDSRPWSGRRRPRGLLQFGPRQGRRTRLDARSRPVAACWAQASGPQADGVDPDPRFKHLRHGLRRHEGRTLLDGVSERKIGIGFQTRSSVALMIAPHTTPSGSWRRRSLAGRQAPAGSRPMPLPQSHLIINPNVVRFEDGGICNKKREPVKKHTHTERMMELTAAASAVPSL